MKLYTEEQVREAIMSINTFKYILDSHIDDIIDSLTPIELPSDEEIGKGCKEWYNKPSFTIGAKWVINHIKQQDNGKQTNSSTMAPR